MLCLRGFHSNNARCSRDLGKIEFASSLLHLLTTNISDIFNVIPLSVLYCCHISPIPDCLLFVLLLSEGFMFYLLLV